MKHPVIDYLLASAACEINDQHNAKMLAEGRYIPWWRRHLMLTIALVFASPVILIGAFIVLVNTTNPSAATVNVFAQVVVYFGVLAFLVAIVYAYIRAEKKWKRETNRPTKVINIR